MMASRRTSAAASWRRSLGTASADRPRAEGLTAQGTGGLRLEAGVEPPALHPRSGKLRQVWSTLDQGPNADARGGGSAS